MRAIAAKGRSYRIPLRAIAAKGRSYSTIARYVPDGVQGALPQARSYNGR